MRMYALCECRNFDYRSDCPHAREAIRRWHESDERGPLEMEICTEPKGRSYTVQIVP